MKLLATFVVISYALETPKPNVRFTFIVHEIHEWSIFFPILYLVYLSTQKHLQAKKQPCVNARMCMCPAKWITSVVSASGLPLIPIHTYSAQHCPTNPLRWRSALFRLHLMHQEHTFQLLSKILHWPMLLHIADQAVSKASIWHHPSFSRASPWQLNPDVITSTTS